MGYITKGNGISIHRETCPNIRNIEERLIDVEWNEKTEKKYKLDLLITTTQNKNILIDIISKTTNNNITIISVNTLSENIKYKLRILVENKQTLDKFTNDLKSIPTISSIERLIQ